MVRTERKSEAFTCNAEEMHQLVDVLLMGTSNVKYSVVRNAALEAFCDLIVATEGNLFVS